MAHADLHNSQRTSRRGAGCAATLAGALVLLAAGGARAEDCLRRYVAGGDHLPAGHEVTESERFPNQLVEDHLSKWGPWCVYDLAKNETTSSTYLSGGQFSQSWNLRPDLVTVTLGEENATIVKLVTDCFDKVKAHEFAEASACASVILGAPNLWTNLKQQLSTILGYYRTLMMSRPKLVVAVTGYPNPYPDPTTAAASVAALCNPLLDTAPTCTARWSQLPAALVALDQVFKKLNSTLQEAVHSYAYPMAGRYVFVDTYTKLRPHCMKMEVEIQTKVYHPERNSAEDHNSPKVNFGCSDPWFVAGENGYASPTYLNPAAFGALVYFAQTTSGMGVHPNADGHECISDLVWEADTIDPGTSPLKWKLGVPEAADPGVCQ